MTTAIRHDVDGGRYELVVDGEPVSVLGYERRGDVVVLQHTGTEPEHRHRGHATALVASVLAELDRDGLRTVVRCPFVRSYLQAREQLSGGEGPGDHLAGSGVTGDHDP